MSTPNHICGKCGRAYNTELDLSAHYCMPSVRMPELPCSDKCPKAPKQEGPSLKAATTEEIREELELRGWKVKLTI